jgi:apolipoprotein N-acyltransferase
MIYRNPAKRHVWQAEIALPIITVMLLFIGGLFWIKLGPQVAAQTKFLRAALVQPSIPQTLIWSPTEDEKRFTELLDVSQQAMTNQPDLLVWPESAVPMFDGVYDLISRFARTNHVAIIFNGDDTGFGPAATNYYNAAFLINPDGVCTGRYHKQKLVIFGEYIPLVRWLPFLKYFTPIQDGWTPGDQPALFTGENFSAAPLICFEDVFPGVARAAAAGRPDFLVNLTNDGWFSESAEQWQHLANAVFRTVENNLPLVVCANNGITCWVDAHGRIRQVLRNRTGNEYAAGVLNLEIPLAENSQAGAPTFYQRHGNWFAWSCTGVALLGWLGGWRKRRRPE